MGVLTDILVAHRSEAAVVCRSLAPFAEWSGIDAQGIDLVKLGALWCQLSGAPYRDSVLDDFLF